MWPIEHPLFLRWSQIVIYSTQILVSAIHSSANQKVILKDFENQPLNISVVVFTLITIFMKRNFLKYNDDCFILATCFSILPNNPAGNLFFISICQILLNFCQLYL